MSFSLNDFLSPESLKDSHKSERKIAMIAADKLHPADGNFYSKEDDRIQKMAASILMLSTPGKIGIQQNLVVRPIPDTDEYTILAGETRWSAVMSLLEDGELDTDQIPCEIEQADDPIRDELILILTNSTQRVRSDAEKMHEVKRLRELLEEYKKNHKIDGTIQKAIGDLLGISKTKVGTLENIDRNLSPELTAEYEKGNINTSVANKLAGMDEDAQRAGKELLDAKGAITAEDVKTLSETKDNDNPYGHTELNEDQEPVYEMKYKVADEPEDDSESSEEPLHFNMDLPNKQESKSELQETVVDSRRIEDTGHRKTDFIPQNDTSWSDDDINRFIKFCFIKLDSKARVYLSLNNIGTNMKKKVTGMANNSLRKLFIESGCKESQKTSYLDFLTFSSDDRPDLYLNDFVFPFYEAIIDLVLAVIKDCAEDIMENYYGGYKN